MSHAGFRQRLAGALDLPRDLVMNLPHVSITAGVQVVVENHRGLRACYPDRVVVGGRQGELAITGEELVVVLLTRDELVVRGQIHQVTFT